jgi:Helix-turn-helix.
MEAKKEKTHPHHGRNAKISRNIRGMSQLDVADKLGVDQKKISIYEASEELNDETLEQIADAVDVSVDFLKTFEPDELFKTYNVYDNKFSNSPETESNSPITQQVGLGENHNEQENIYNTYYPLEKVSELYERIVDLRVQLATAENRNSDLQEEIKRLKAEIEKLKG